MSPEFDVQLTAKDLYRFNMKRSYTTLQGPISIIIAILFCVSAVVTGMHYQFQYTALYGAAALLFWLYIPVTLKGRAKKVMAKDAVLSGVLHYTFTDTGIQVKSGEQSAELPWKNVFKMTAGKKYVYIFSNRINAYIIPREQMGEQYEAVRDLAKANLEKYRISMK